MNNFAFARARRPADALRLGSGGDVAFIAGGTELMNWMRLGIAAPGGVVDLGLIEGMRGMRKEGESLWIGSLTTLADIEADPRVRAEAPVLAEACLRAASPQIRNRATLGGNVLQKTRCAYFRAEAPLPWSCNKREPGSGCAAIEGQSEQHAIFGWTDACAATMPSDPAVALACLDATVELSGPNGERSVPATEFHLTQEEAARQVPGDEAARTENRLLPGELIMAFRVPLAGARQSAYVKVRPRESFEYALVSAAAALTFDGGVVGALRIALGSVAQKPWRLYRCEQALAGRPLSREGTAAAIWDSLSEARPLRENAFKVRLAANAALRAIELAGSRT